jgi:hypothetical protein
VVVDIRHNGCGPGVTGRRPDSPGRSTTPVGPCSSSAQLLGARRTGAAVDLVQWSFLVPCLARLDADPNTSLAQGEAVNIVFQSLNRHLGIAVGEHRGYLSPAPGPSWSASPSPKPASSQLAGNPRDRHRRVLMLRALWSS